MKKHYLSRYALSLCLPLLVSPAFAAVDAAFPDSASVRDVVAFLRSGGKRRFTIPRLSAAEAADDDDDDS